MKVRVRADSSARTTRALSSWPALHSELRMVVRQNAGRCHVELKYAQLRVFLDVLNELISERRRAGLAIAFQLASVARTNSVFGASRAICRSILPIPMRMKAR